MRDSWLEAHAYLRPLAELSAEVERAAADIAISEAPLPDWDHYRADFLAGVTLLQSTDAAVDLDPGGRTAAALIEKLALAGSSGWFAAETQRVASLCSFRGFGLGCCSSRPTISEPRW